MMKTIELKIYKDGRIDAETHGIRGKTCLDYVGILEQLTGARAVDSDFTAEYFEPEEWICGSVCKERADSEEGARGNRSEEMTNPETWIRRSLPEEMLEAEEVLYGQTDK